MNKKRLLKLADFLDELPRKLFDFGTVATVGEEGLTPAQALKAGPKCGTVGCAMGWAPVVFPRILKYAKVNEVYPNETWYDEDLKQLYIALRDESGLDPGTESYRKNDYSLIASKVFDIPESEAQALFTPGDTDWEIPALMNELPETATPKQVAKRIRRYVKQTEKEQELATV